jgi:hypothetical protein
MRSFASYGPFVQATIEGARYGETLTWQADKAFKISINVRSPTATCR